MNKKVVHIKIKADETGINPVMGQNMPAKKMKEVSSTIPGKQQPIVPLADSKERSKKINSKQEELE